MSQSTKRSYGVMASLLLIVGVGVIFFSLIVPKSSDIQALRGERLALKEAVQEEREAVEAVQALLNEYVSISDLQNNLSLSLPIEEEVPNIVNQLQGIAKLSGVVIESVSLQRLPIKPSRSGNLVTPVGTMEITMSLKSPYESLKLYLEGIETNIRIMDVVSINIEGGATSEILSYTLVVKTYYQR